MMHLHYLFMFLCMPCDSGVFSVLDESSTAFL